jgi:RNA polymerase sigma-70 factor (ECF subfamily)
MSNLEFVAQFDRLKMTLFAFALNLTKDRELAQDLVQETAYKAFKHRNRYEPQTNLRAWLMTIMRNSFINDYRKRKRRQTFNDSSGNDYLLDSGHHTVNNLGESQVTMDELQKSIESLEAWMRVPFMLHFRGFKYEEIADELGLPIGTVKSRIFSARQKLQEQVKSIYLAHELTDILN